MERRFYLGVGILALFLALGLLIAWGVERTGAPIVQDLEQAVQAFLEGRGEQGIRLAEQARTAWQQSWAGVAAVADHTPMDEIDGLFAQLQYYTDAGNFQALGAYCARLSELVEAISDAHKLTWWNIL